MYDIITIGGATRDVFLLSDKFTFIHSRAFETGIGECVSFGTKIELDKVVFTTGGGATNAAVTFANLGYNTAALCRVGDDATGRDLLAGLEINKVKTDLIKKVVGGQTAYSTLLTAPNGERTALILRGVSASFSNKDIPWTKIKTRVVYLTSLGGNFALSKKIIEAAKESGALIVWNPGKGELKKGLAAFKKILPRIDIFNLNREEIELLTGKKEIKEMFTALAKYTEIIIVTDGPRGAYVETGGKIWHASTTGARSVSSTGAGDAFGSGFTAGFLKHEDVKKALAVGMINAEGVIQKIGAKAGIIKRWPTEKQMKKIKISKYASV